jgi:hypothetical protein
LFLDSCRTIGHAGPKVVVVVLKSVQKAKGAADDSEETYTHAQSHEAACNIAERARSVWDLDIVLVLLSEEKQFCSSSVAPPAGMSKSQMEYIQTVAENAMEMGLTENALTFSLLRIHSLLAKSNSKAMAIRRPSQPELKQARMSAPFEQNRSASWIQFVVKVLRCFFLVSDSFPCCGRTGLHLCPFAVYWLWVSRQRPDDPLRYVAL